MRWVTYVSEDGDERAGIVHDGNILGAPAGVTLIDLVAGGTRGLAEAASEILSAPGEVVPEDRAVLRAPIPRPPSVRDFMAFEDHVLTTIEAMGEQMKPVWYEIPVFYFSNPAAIRGAFDEVPISPGCQTYDFELESAVVIGEGGYDIDPRDAEKHIAGYTILCDWSARDLQALEMQQGLGPAKGKDGATSLGPWLVTPDELEPRRAGKAFDLTMTAKVNGREYSRGSMSSLYWSFAQMIAFASRGTTLVPGDVIGSGTVGTGCILELSRVHGTDAYPWLKAGDEVELSIDLLGSIRSRILPGSQPAAL